jgi:hypothetical protein
MTGYEEFSQPQQMLPDVARAQALARALVQSGKYMAIGGEENFKQTAVMADWNGRKIVVVNQMIPVYSGDPLQWTDASAWATVAVDAQTFEVVPEYAEREVPDA